MKIVLDLLVNQVHEIWGAGDYVASLLMLDITGTYDRVICRRLVHVLRAIADGAVVGSDPLPDRPADPRTACRPRY